MTLSVVMPAHNEEASLPQLVPAIVQELASSPFEIIIVDDGSTDATWAVIERLSSELSGRVRGVRLTRNFGHQAALLAGLASARGDAVLMMDADGQHPPACIPRFVEQWRAGHVVVQGVRTSTEREGALKRWTSRAFYRTLSLFGGPEVQIGSADFRLLTRPALEVVLESAGPLLFLRGLIPWLGYTTAYVPFEAKQRYAGKSSYTWFRMLRFAVHGLLGFTIVPLRAATLLGLAVAAFAFLYLVVVVVAWATSAPIVPGWASVMGLVALLGGIQLVTIGLLGEYLGRVFVAQLKRPHFVVRERCGEPVAVGAAAGSARR
jgi:dolichol-phosphate mannosyltransferase